MQFLSTCLSMLAVAFAPLAEVGEEAIYKQQAGAYFEALITGEAEKADTLTAAPFSLDRERVLNTIEEVKGIHKSIATQRGKRQAPKYTVAKTDKAPALDAKLFPKYVAYRVAIDGGKEFIDIYLTIGSAPKVIGFSD